MRTVTEIFANRRTAQNAYMAILNTSYFGAPDHTAALDAMNAADEEFIALLDARRATGLCCCTYLKSTNFPCSNPIDPAADCSSCQACQDREEALEGFCDGLAAARNDHQRDE